MSWFQGTRGWWIRNKFPFFPPVPRTLGQRRAPAGSRQPEPGAPRAGVGWAGVGVQVGSHLMRFCRPCLLEFRRRIALVMVAAAERRAGSRLPPPSPRRRQPPALRAPAAPSPPSGSSAAGFLLFLLAPPLLHTPGSSPPPLPPPPPPPPRGSVTGESPGARPAAGPAAQSPALPSAEGFSLLCFNPLLSLLHLLQPPPPSPPHPLFFYLYHRCLDYTKQLGSRIPGWQLALSRL